MKFHPRDVFKSKLNLVELKHRLFRVSPKDILDICEKCTRYLSIKCREIDLLEYELYNDRLRCYGCKICKPEFYDEEDDEDDEEDNEENVCFEKDKIYQIASMRNHKRDIYMLKKKKQNLESYISLCDEIRYILLAKIEPKTEIFSFNTKFTFTDYIGNKSIEYFFTATMRDYLTYRYPSIIFPSEFLYELGKLITMNKCRKTSTRVVNHREIQVKRYSLFSLLYLDEIMKIFNRLPSSIHQTIFRYLTNSRNMIPMI